MPVAWFPFPAGHRYAGKFYVGRIPEGDVARLAEMSGASLTNPGEGTVVTPGQVITDELVDTESAVEMAVQELTSLGKSAVAAPAARQATALADEIESLVASGDIARARDLMGTLEDVRDSLLRALANVVPVAVIGRDGSVAAASSVADASAPGPATKKAKRGAAVSPEAVAD